MIHVIFPAYNEEDSIRPAILALADAVRGREQEYHAILVDDGSVDRTIDEANLAITQSGGKLKLTILKHEVNKGLGAGLRTGIFGCLDIANNNDVIVTLDADNTHPPKLIPEMVNLIGRGFDIVIASRYQKGAIIHGVPAHRRWISDLAKLLFQATFYIRGARDYTCCFRAYRVPILRKARAVYGDEFCTARGFEAVMDILLRLRQLDIRAAEVPLELRYEQRVGRSKMQVFRTARKTLALLSKRFVERLGRYSKTNIRLRMEQLERSGAFTP
ncbi:MAG: glycosyltransferase [Planctomycetota bacterium]